MFQLPNNEFILRYLASRTNFNLEYIVYLLTSKFIYLLQSLLSRVFTFLLKLFKLNWPTTTEKYKHHAHAALALDFKG